MDHHLSVRTALDLLKPRIEAYVHSRLKACFGAVYLAREPRLARKPDTQALLSILLDHWQRCFSEVLKPSDRSIAHELKAARNLWAHEAEITWDQAYRCADNVQLLLHAIGARDADLELERIKAALRGVESHRNSGNGPPPPPPQPQPQGNEPHPSFGDFMEKSVLPQRARNPEAVRLDGRTSGGNRRVFGRFWYGGELWRVNSDTHFEPLLLAYEGRDSEPFVRTATASGMALELHPELQAARKTRHKNLYIYATT